MRDEVMKDEVIAGPVKAVEPHLEFILPPSYFILA
jgi:hypothetical protein